MMIEVANAVRLPPMPTREEIAQYCNQGMTDRKHQITVRTVRGWHENGLIKPIKGLRNPVRYDARQVADLISGQLRLK